jgi:glutathione S-transferase
MGFKARRNEQDRPARVIRPVERYSAANHTLISYRLDPFVQRAVIALEEKDLPYDLEYIDLGAKPDWFLDLSPLGSTPILRVGDRVLYEATVITEYLEEITPERPLHPGDPLERAFHRAWVEFLSGLLHDAQHLALAPDEAEARLVVQIIRGKLAHFEQDLGAGAFIDGDRFSLVDAAAAPLMQRLTWIDDLAPYLGLFASTPRVAGWRDTLLARDSVQASLLPDARDLYFEFLQGRGTSRTEEAEPSWLGALTMPPEPQPRPAPIHPDAVS